MDILLIMRKFILIAIIVCLGSCQDAVFQKVLLKDPGALCLDGTPGAYYIHPGTDPSRILLYFEGGGWCGEPNPTSTIESCYRRSKGKYGTSKDYSE